MVAEREAYDVDDFGDPAVTNLTMSYSRLFDRINRIDRIVAEHFPALQSALHPVNPVQLLKFDIVELLTIR